MDKQMQEWAKAVTSPHAYLMRGASKTYVGLDANQTLYCFKFDDDIQNTYQRLHRGFKNLVTNKEEYLSVWDKEILERCRKVCEKQYKIDVGLDYQVKGGDIFARDM